MSGHSGFLPIGNNVNPAVFPPAGGVQGAQGPQNAPGAANSQGAAPAEALPEPAPAEAGGAKAFVRELDILLARAGKAAGGAIDEAALVKAAKAAKPDNAAVAALREAAKAANDARRVLDTLRGADLARAMARDKATGVVDWVKDDFAGKAVKDALEKQQALSNALLKLLNKLPKSATAAQQAAIEEAMMQCDRRIGEIETIVLELTDAVEKGIVPKDEETRARLNRRVVDLAGEKALEMHDRKGAIQSFRDRLAPIAASLDNFAAHPGEPVPKAQLSTFRRTIDEARNAIAQAAKDGFVKVPAPGGGTRDLFVDRTFLDEAAKLLAEADSKLAKLRDSAALAMRRKFVENDIPWPKVALLQPQLAAKIRELGGNNAEREKTAAVADLVERLAKLHAALRAYADKPSSPNYNKIIDAFDPLQDKEFEKLYANGFEVIIGIVKSPNPIADPALRAAAEEFTSEFGGINGNTKTLTDQIVRLSWRSDIVLDHLEALSKRVKSSPALETSDAIRAIFSGEGSFSTLVESRVHGYADGDIDQALDDANVVESHRLGSGNFNTVDIVSFKDGTRRAFKPEFAGRMASMGTPILAGIEGKQQLTRINRAVNKTADALGLGDVMVKTTAGVHGGVFGMYMEAAPGVEGRKLASNARPVVDENGSKVALGTDDLRALSSDQRRIVRGRIMRQLNRLHWFDVITGQGDRHSGNYMIQVKPDLTVTVKGIDNDASFGPLRTGLHTFRLPPRIAKAYMDRVRLLSAGYGSKSQLAVDKVTSDPGFKKLRDGTIELDLSKAQSPLVVSGLWDTTGFQNTSVPNEMDWELYDKLVQLKGGAPRTALLAEWSERLGAGTPQFQAAVNRLDEAIALAERLHAEGKVYKAEEWENAEVQKRIDEAPLPLDPSAPILGVAPHNKLGRTLVSDYEWLMTGSYFKRDFDNLL